MLDGRVRSVGADGRADWLDRAPPLFVLGAENDVVRGPIFKVVGTSQVDKHGLYRCVVRDATPGGIPVVRSVLGAISSLPIVAFRDWQPGWSAPRRSSSSAPKMTWYTHPSSCASHFSKNIRSKTSRLTFNTNAGEKNAPTHMTERSRLFREREFFVDDPLVRIHFIIAMIRWTGLAP